jgi:hypothetical protein
MIIATGWKGNYHRRVRPWKPPPQRARAEDQESFFIPGYRADQLAALLADGDAESPRVFETLHDQHAVAARMTLHFCRAPARAQRLRGKIKTDECRGQTARPASADPDFRFSSR